MNSKPECFSLECITPVHSSVVVTSLKLTLMAMLKSCRSYMIRLQCIHAPEWNLPQVCFPFQ